MNLAVKSLESHFGVSRVSDLAVPARPRKGPHPRGRCRFCGSCDFGKEERSRRRVCHRQCRGAGKCAGLRSSAKLGWYVWLRWRGKKSPSWVTSVDKSGAETDELRDHHNLARTKP